MVDKKRTIEKHEQSIEELKTLSFPEGSEGSSVNKDVSEALNLRLIELMKSFEAFAEKPEGLQELITKAFREGNEHNVKTCDDVTSGDLFSGFMAAHTNLHFVVKQHYKELWSGPDLWSTALLAKPAGCEVEGGLASEERANDGQGRNHYWVPCARSIILPPPT